MDNFAYKNIVALLAATVVLLLVSPHHAFGQTWTTQDADAVAHINTGQADGLTASGASPPPLIAAGHNLALGNAAHTLTITDDNASTTLSLGNITTVNNGGGTLIFDLQNSGTNLTFTGNIGNSSSRRITTVEVQNSGGGLSVGNVFASVISINSGQALSAATVDARILTNNGTLTTTGATNAGMVTNDGTMSIAGGTVGTLGGSGNITSTSALTINNTTPSGYGGTINSTDLTVRQGLFRNTITTSGNFTANLNGNLTIEKTVTVGGNATFTGNRRVDLEAIKITGNLDVASGTTIVFSNIKDSTFNATTTNNKVNGTLEVYGTAPSSTYSFDTSGGGKIVDTSIFTNMVTTSPGVHTIGPAAPRPSALMSDGFLTALTIHHRYTAWNMVRDRLISGNGHDEYGRNLWFNGTGRSNRYRSSFKNQTWKTVTGGGQIGGDLFYTNRFQSGLLFGYEEGKSENDTDRLKSHDFYFGLYGTYIFHNGADTRIVFAEGWQSYGLNRLGNGNIHYTSSFNGWTSEANFELGKRLGGGAWSLRPVAAVDVYNNNLKATHEDGNGTERVAYGKTNFTQVFFRTGTDLRNRTKDYTINSGIYYAYDVNGAELKTHAHNVDVPSLNAPLVGTKWGRSLLLFNLGVEGEIDRHFSVFGGYLGECALDSANGALQSIGYVGVFGKW